MTLTLAETRLIKYPNRQQVPQVLLLRGTKQLFKPNLSRHCLTCTLLQSSTVRFVVKLLRDATTANLICLSEYSHPSGATAQLLSGGPTGES